MHGNRKEGASNVAYGQIQNGGEWEKSGAK